MGGTPVFIADSDSTWASILLVDGLYQGHNLSSLLFCLGLRKALKRFEEQCSARLVLDDLPLHMEYIDDLLMKMRSDTVGVVMPLLEAAFGISKLKLNRSKCKGLIPSAHEGAINLNLDEIELPQAYGSLELLGGVFDGEFAPYINACGGGNRKSCTETN